MSFKDDIEKKYTILLKKAKEYDSLFDVNKESGWKKYEIPDSNIEKYWYIREQMENDIPEFMNIARKAIEKIPQKDKNFKIEDIEDASYPPYNVKIYDNIHYPELIGFFHKFERNIEINSLANIRSKKVIYDDIRDVKAYVLSFSKSLDLFLPDVMISIEQQVDTIFNLRDMGMDEEAILLEQIDSEENPVQKCLKARTALENIIAKYCKDNDIKVQKGFYNNLDNAITKGMTEKQKRKSIAGHYTYVSKIVHGEIDPTPKNVEFAVNGVINIINSII